MFGHVFYQEYMRKYVAVFGTLFNGIIITRNDNNGNEIQRLKVPIAYGPQQKFLAMLEQNPKKKAHAIQLPRISFEITNMSYDPTRKLTRNMNSSNQADYRNAVPYDINFQLSIMTNYYEDGSKIIEQILPFFTPEFTPSVELISGETPYQIPVILNSVSNEDTYESDFLSTRALIWTLDFTVKAVFFGPENTGNKLIKIAKANVYDGLDANTYQETIEVRPGLTANGEPTSNTSNSVDVANINFEDDWGYIVTISDYEE